MCAAVVREGHHTDTTIAACSERPSLGAPQRPTYPGAAGLRYTCVAQLCLAPEPVLLGTHMVAGLHS